MNSIKNFLLNCFLLFWWVNFEFVNRLAIFPLFNISLFKILSSILVLFFLIFNLGNGKIKVIPISIWVIFFLIVFISFIAFLYSERMAIQVPFNISDRYLTQLVSLISSFVLGLFIYDSIKNHSNGFFRFLKYGYILVFLSVLWQILFIGLDFFPRLYGLAGEPKALGLILVPFISALYFEGLNNKFENKVLLFISGSILVFTLSSTAFIALFIVLFFIFFCNSNKGIPIYKFSFGLASLIVFLLFVTDLYDLDEVIFGRIFNRVVGEYVFGVQTVVDIPFVGNITIDGNDAPVARMFLDNPFIMFTGVGFGFQAIFSYEYMLKYDSGFLDMFYTGYITPNIALLNHFSNYGFLIFIFLFLDGIKAIKSLLKLSLESNLRFIIIYFSSWFIISCLVYEMTFKIIFLYLILKSLNFYLKKVNYA